MEEEEKAYFEGQARLEVQRELMLEDEMKNWFMVLKDYKVI